MTMSKSQSPWAWRPSRTAWYQKLEERLVSWQPIDALHLNRNNLHDCIMAAIAGEAHWLLHPSINSLTLDIDRNRIQRDFQLSVWVAAQSQQSLDTVHVPELIWLWSPDGSLPVPPGNYDLDDLRTLIVEAQWCYPLMLDVWCHSVGFSLPASWAMLSSITDKQHQQLRNEINVFRRSIAIVQANFVDCLEWVKAVTQVVIPLYCEAGVDKFRSGSQQNVPGMVYFDLGDGEMHAIEALVHESAHQHLFLAEASGPLVNPDHHDRYASPLRSEPRPLRGILLAYHAIAYICAFYRDALSSKLHLTAYHNYCQQELQTLWLLLDEAEQTLSLNQQHLTESGQEFFEQTREVANYGRQESQQGSWQK